MAHTYDASPFYGKRPVLVNMVVDNRVMRVRLYIDSPQTLLDLDPTFFERIPEMLSIFRNTRMYQGSKARGPAAPTTFDPARDLNMTGRMHDYDYFDSVGISIRWTLIRVPFSRYSVLPPSLLVPSVRGRLECSAFAQSLAAKYHVTVPEDDNDESEESSIDPSGETRSQPVVLSSANHEMVVVILTQRGIRT
ncbi:hypothetical protein KIPB_001501 [Kipferlia bialata]|uniref:Uncharacterized protein n=1 Tax=Kipferlia bialata TaxID=797122 RepID=A0A391NIV2_9EUKA|nr:hypothetical protein KIPB_001501 [Kipferlia bialata]|eukprot:g1501.t1